MPRYYFNSDNGETFRDESGIELETDAAAKIEATRLFADLISEHPATVWRNGIFRLTVTNGEGLALFALDLAAFDAPATGWPRP